MREDPRIFPAGRTIYDQHLESVPYMTVVLPNLSSANDYEFRWTPDNVAQPAGNITILPNGANTDQSLIMLGTGTGAPAWPGLLLLSGAGFYPTARGTLYGRQNGISRWESTSDGYSLLALGSTTIDFESLSVYWNPWGSQGTLRVTEFVKR